MISERPLVGTAHAGHGARVGFWVLTLAMTVLVVIAAVYR